MQFNYHVKKSNEKMVAVLDDKIKELVLKVMKNNPTCHIEAYDIVPKDYLKGYYITLAQSPEGIGFYVLWERKSSIPVATGEFVHTEEQRKLLVSKAKVYEGVPEAPAFTITLYPKIEWIKNKPKVKEFGVDSGYIEKVIGFCFMFQEEIDKRNKGE